MDQGFLCVGGPHDGQRVALPPGRRRMCVPLNPAAMMAAYRMSDPQPLLVEYVQYEIEELITAGGVLLIWRPEDQTTHETLRRLIAGYRPAR